MWPGRPKVCGVLYLMRQVEFAATAQRDRRTEHATRIFQHEIHHFRRDFLGGANQVALVFAVFVIDHNHEFSLAKVVESLFDCIQFE